jgi:uncharacterized protein with HEPN domain
MIDAIDRIEAYVGSIREEEFLSNTLIQDAVVRNIEIIGEAANNIMKCDPDITRAHSEVPWITLYAMRNRLTHGYFTIDFGVVWTTIRTDFPTLRPAIARLLATARPPHTPGSR